MKMLKCCDFTYKIVRLNVPNGTQTLDVALYRLLFFFIFQERGVTLV